MQGDWPAEALREHYPNRPIKLAIATYKEGCQDDRAADGREKRDAPASTLLRAP